MAVFIWHLVKNDLASVCYCKLVHWTRHFLQGTRNTRPCITGHPVRVQVLLYNLIEWWGGVLPWDREFASPEMAKVAKFRAFNNPLKFLR